MNRATLTLLAASGSLATLLVLSPAANALDNPAEGMTRLNNTPVTPVTSYRSHNPILDAMGCGCTTCVRGLLEMHGQLVL